MTESPKKLIFPSIIFMLLLSFVFLLSCHENISDAQPLKADALQSGNLKAAVVGGNYFVATNGNDLNPGTAGAPFRTIVRASEVAKPGDVITVKDGTYIAADQYMNFVSCKGTADKYITFKSESKYGAVLDGNQISHVCFAPLYGSSYIRFIDFEIKNFLRGAFDIHHEPYISSYITIEGCKIHNIGRIDDVEDYGRSAIYINQPNHHITINGNIFYNIGRTGPDDYWLNKDHAVYVGEAKSLSESSHHVTITNNVMYKISGSAVELGGNNDLIANNVFAWPNENRRGGNTFISGSGPGIHTETIANNIFYQPGTGYAMVNYSSASTWVVKNNMVYGGSMWAFHKPDNIASMAGGNYGRGDCEYPEVDPLFVSAVKGNSNIDFRLQSKSPAINKGANVGLNTDFLNNGVNGLPDIGAIEFGGTDNTNTTITQPVITTTYYSIAITMTGNKNDCGAGYDGSAVTGTLAAGTFTSAISQADADKKALDYANANKQAYFNAHGTCIEKPTSNPASTQKRTWWK